MDEARRGSPRWLRLSAAAFAGGLLLGVAPVPRMDFVAGATTDTAVLELLPSDVVPQVSHEGHGHDSTTQVGNAPIDHVDHVDHGDHGAASPPASGPLRGGATELAHRHRVGATPAQEPTVVLRLGSPRLLAPAEPGPTDPETTPSGREPAESGALERRSGREEGVEPFDTIGVRLDEAPDDPVMLRVRDADGRWGEWNELEVNLDEGPDQSSPEASAQHDDGVLSQPIWVGEATGYEVNLAADDAPDGDLEVAVVRPTTRRVVADAVPLAEAAVAAPFGINSRASWSARAPKENASIAPSLKLAVVHHTASSNNYSASQVPGILRSIQAFHMDGNGWNDIGYNFLVDKYGGLWEGRGGGTSRNVIGAHAGGFNTGSVGVSVLGNYTSASPSSPAIEAVSRIVGYRLQLAGVRPTSRVNVTSGGSSSIPAGRVVNLPVVVGHRDVGATSCPASYQSRLPSIRTRAADWFAATEALSTPRGGIDSVRVNGNRVDVIGWAVDPDAGSPARVHVVIAGRLNEVFADGFRPDVGRAYGVGDYRGWGAGFPNLPEGTHRMCATVINQGAGNDKLLGCRDVVVK